MSIESVQLERDDIVFMGRGGHEEQRRISAALTSIHSGSGTAAHAEALGMGVPLDGDLRSPTWRDYEEAGGDPFFGTLPEKVLQPISLAIVDEPPELLALGEQTVEGAKDVFGRLKICGGETIQLALVAEYDQYQPVSVEAAAGALVIGPMPELVNA